MDGLGLRHQSVFCFVPYLQARQHTSRKDRMSQKTVLSVGQCAPDHAALSQFLAQHFGVQILTADLPAETLEILRSRTVDLVLINRKLDVDYSEGMDILRAVKDDPELASTPIMIVSNFEDAQQAAVAAGAVYGIGKAELTSQAARDRVAAVLS